MKIVLDRVNVMRDNFSLTAHGEFSDGVHLVSGAVGSGKSTLTLAIANVLPLESGSISRCGIESMMLSLQFPEYQVTGLTLADECFSWGCEPAEIFLSSEIQGKEHQSPFTLSRGELKQLHLSCVLNKHYDLLLLDEPFSSLDCEKKQKFCSRLSQRTKSITIIFTHEQAILPKVDRIWEIIDGVLHDRGVPPAAIERWCGAPPFIKKLVASGKTPRNISSDEVLEAACRT